MLVRAYNNLNNYHLDTCFLTQNTPGNDGVTFHTIEEQDEFQSIGAESLTMGSFTTQGDNHGRGGGHGFGHGGLWGSGQKSILNNRPVKCPMLPLPSVRALCIQLYHTV